MKKIIILFVGSILFQTNLFCQQTCWFRDDRELNLSDGQKLALTWFCTWTDSLKIDSMWEISQTPFHWDDQVIITDKLQLSKALKKARFPSMLIDTVLVAPEVSKEKYFSTEDRKFEVIEIDFYVPNSLHTYIIYVAVSPPNKKIIGFYWIGDIIRPRRPFISPGSP